MSSKKRPEFGAEDAERCVSQDAGAGPSDSIRLAGLNETLEPTNLTNQWRSPDSGQQEEKYAPYFE